MAKGGIICQACGVEAPVKYVEFHQNIGVLIMRFHRAVKGTLCKNCVHANFWKMTGTTLGIGWLGTISLVIAPIFVLMNLTRYLSALGMPATPAGAAPPTLDEAAIARLAPHATTILQRLNANEEFVDIMHSVSSAAGVTPGQALLYTIELGKPRLPETQRAGGFPAIPLAQPAQAMAQLAPPPPLGAKAVQ